MRDKIVIGTRKSALALWQADYVADCIKEKYPEITVEKKLIVTKGDKILDTPLAKIGGKGLFTKALEDEMLAGDIDIAVHSLKDVPTELPEGLMIAAITKRFDPGDALVSPKYGTLDKLPKGAKIGTSSLRRSAQLLHARPDLKIESLRGNVNTRLQKLEDENFDGIILAVAGLKRLEMEDRITQVLPVEICLPAVGQGALAIEARRDDEEILSIIDFLNDETTVACTNGERAFLKAVEGGCQVPVGVYGTPSEDGISLEAVIASVDGKQLYRDSVQGSPEEAEHLGKALADRLLNAGGRKILQELGLLKEDV